LILTLNLFTNFSLLPLQFVSAVGFCAAIAGFVTALFFLFLYLLSSIAVPGFASIIISILVMGGIQLMALGIMGEYIGRLHLNVNRKPQYTVRQVTGSLDRHEFTRGPGAVVTVERRAQELGKSGLSSGRDTHLA
jgi:undecaprenyl-phosphate 4-deoxy-4-formamido-L-arabinose transferase